MPFVMKNLRKEMLVVSIFDSLGKEGSGCPGHGAGKLSVASRHLTRDGQSCTGEQGLSLCPMMAKRLSHHPSAVPSGLK